VAIRILISYFDWKNVPQVSNSRLSPLPHEPAFSGSSAANDATDDIPLGGGKVSQ
jgi:hypothetical protein